MRRVLISFLGKGSIVRQTGKYDYRVTRYKLGNKASRQTKFVQVGICDLKNIDHVYILATQDSAGLHFNDLKIQLKATGVERISLVTIDDGLTAGDYWSWFEKIIQCVEPGDELFVDITHGYRVMGVVFTNAIGFILKTFKVNLKAVFYGALDRDPENAPLMDVRDFFVIHAWAEGIERLLQDGDARKVVDIEKIYASQCFEALRDWELIRAVSELSEKIRNVDVEKIHSAARNVMELVKEKKKNAGAVAQRLFEMIEKKYERLAVPSSLSGNYGYNYFRHHLEIIAFLLEHKLYMQAFTAMRELVASIGLANIKTPVKARSAIDRRKIANAFIQMISKREKEWRFEQISKNNCEYLKKHYKCLLEIGVIGDLSFFFDDLRRMRNGFDHAWMTENSDGIDFGKKGKEYKEKLVDVVEKLRDNRIIH